MFGVMMERVAVLSDIHGVLPALEAVLAEPDVRDAERIVLTGDIAAGPLPVETLDLLTSLGDRAVWVSGNGDRALVEDNGDSRFVSAWAAQQLRPEQVALLSSLPATAELAIAGLGRVLFCHATPRDDEEIVLVDSRAERWAEVLEGVRDDITTIVCGHTHMPYVRLVHGRMVVNPGSVGMPYGLPGAHWVLLGPGITLRRTPIALEPACTRLATESAFPGAAEWANEYLRRTASAEKAIEVFGPGDGRG